MEKVLVYGLKKSGLSSIDILLDDYKIYIFDDDKTTLQKANKIYSSEVFVLENFTKESIKDFAFIVISPSISIYNENIILAKSMGIKVIGEMELGYNYGIKPLVSVTGSNGKSTTVKLIEHIFRRSKLMAKGVGNIGQPLTSFYITGQKYLINEVSSFQLESIENYYTKYGIILNITPNHLDRHRTFEEYKNQKLKLLQCTKTKIINFDDENLRGIKGENVFYFSLKERVKGIYLKGDTIFLNLRKDKKILTLKDICLRGEHNIYNVMASVLFCLLYGIKLRYIKRVLKSFGGLEHRLEIFCQSGGITYVNDSKSTTPQSCLIATKSFGQDIILLVGGSDKNLTYTEMLVNLPLNVKTIIFYGEIADKMRGDFLKANRKDIKIYQSKKLYDAIKTAINTTKKGDVVLLSPATSSFDEFENFEERGKYFKEKVREILNEDKT